MLELEEVDTPTLKGDEVLIKVQAASVNAADWRSISCWSTCRRNCIAFGVGLYLFALPLSWLAPP